MPGSLYGAFARCTGTQTPEADSCVAVTLVASDGNVAPPGSEPALVLFDGIARTLLDVRRGPGQRATGRLAPDPAQIQALLRKQIVPHGKAAKIGALLEARLPAGVPLARRGYRQGRVVRAAQSGPGRSWLPAADRGFDAAGKATIRMKLKVAGRRQLRRATRLHLVAKGMFTPAPDPPVTASRRFSLRR